MGKIINNGNRKEKGLTLLETIVSISILIVVSLATVSIAVFSSNAFKNATARRYFRNEIDSIANLYISYNESDFSTAMNDYLEVEILGYMDSVFYLNSQYKIIEDSSNYAYRLSLDFEEGSLTIGSYSKNNKEIYTRSITK